MKNEIAWPHGEIRGLGNQGTIAVLMEEQEKVSYDLVPAPRVAEDMTYIHGQNSQGIHLTTKEYDLLCFLVANKGQGVDFFSAFPDSSFTILCERNVGYSFELIPE